MPNVSAPSRVREGARATGGGSPTASGCPGVAGARGTRARQRPHQSASAGSLEPQVSQWSRGERSPDATTVPQVSAKRGSGIEAQVAGNPSEVRGSDRKSMSVWVSSQKGGVFVPPHRQSLRRRPLGVGLQAVPVDLVLRAVGVEQAHPAVDLQRSVRPDVDLGVAHGSADRSRVELDTAQPVRRRGAGGSPRVAGRSTRGRGRRGRPGRRPKPPGSAGRRCRRRARGRAPAIPPAPRRAACARTPPAPRRCARRARAPARKGTPRRTSCSARSVAVRKPPSQARRMRAASKASVATMPVTAGSVAASASCASKTASLSSWRSRS